MRDNVKEMFKHLGLGFLNMFVVLLLVAGAQVLLRGRVRTAVALAILCVVVLSAYLLGSRFIEHRYPPELAGLAGASEFAQGLALGVALFSLVMGVLWAVGAYHPAGWAVRGAFGRAAFFALLAATLEETLTRGFLFRLLEIASGTWVALVLSSALFGAAHASNPGATVRSSIAIALEAGVLLGAAYVLTGKLWLPIGLHAGWNFAEGSIFGMTVSGIGPQSQLIAGTLKGPTILTGGAFGPEASVVAVLLCFSVAVFLLWRAGRLRKINRPAWAVSSTSANESKCGGQGS